ncbi:glycosyl hydrolase family 3 N terminal domain-containing protein [Podospora didyma]|uniref:beta-glucosidase n=1 Tax=Podospora didyma TaxID=330526 RepID=A0AAE0KJJ8_9PEZI|nr:glycosyl hydrolase family 3 N terminal domain-containing protein [Podospora didyma]
MANIDVEGLLKKLSVSEKVDLLGGYDFWHTKGIAKYAIPSLRFSDGPNGVRGTKFFNGKPTAIFPCGTALGATFNLPLLRETGEKMGEEAKLKSVHVILGPTINMHRSPLGGRGFESISEDPVLAGLAAAALVNGIQNTGVQATIKHFVCNDQEHRRNAMYAIVTQRALREIYLLPFQLVFRDSKPGALMTAYNGVNGSYCSENTDLYKILRKEWDFDGLVMSDWYGTYSTTAATNAGLDLEMPGPARFRGEVLKFNVGNDKVPRYVVNERSRSVLKFVKKCASSGIPENGPETTGDTPETSELLRRLGIEGTVLLKNDNNLLPLKKDKKTVVLGPNAKIAVIHGGGSAVMEPYYNVTPFAGISAKLTTPPEFTVGSYAHMLLPHLGPQCTTPDGKTGMLMRVYNDPPGVRDRECVDKIVVIKTEALLVDYVNPRLKSALWYADFEGTFVADEDAKYDFGVVVVGSAKLFVDGVLVVDNATTQRQGDSFFGAATVEEQGSIQIKKGQSYQIKVEYASAPTSKLPDNNSSFSSSAFRFGGTKEIDPEGEIQKAVALAKDAEQVIICAGLNADWEQEGLDRDTMDLPGLMDKMIAAVAAANPNTVVVNQSGTPVGMPWIDAVPAVVQAWYGGNETGNIIADVLFGDANPSGKLSVSFPVRLSDNPAFLNFRAEGGRTLYGEDIYIGYRFYEMAHRPVLFPFGHGLSYTTFTFSDLKLTENKASDGGLVPRVTLTVEVTVTNTGSVEGSQVVQVYFAPPALKPQPVATVETVVVVRAQKELKGFSKVKLAPGESKTVKVDIERKYAVSYWDEVRGKWCADDGVYDVIVSDSSVISDDKSLMTQYNNAQTFWWKGL